jgi:hypothetical protein
VLGYLLVKKKISHLSIIRLHLISKDLKRSYLNNIEVSVYGES